MSCQTILLEGAAVQVRAGENLLDACLRSAVTIPFSCRGGVCQTCLLRCTDGNVPARAQRGLADSLREKGYLLACQCQPEGPMTLARPRATDRITACVLHEALPSGPFMHLRFETARALPCRAGDQLQIKAPGRRALHINITCHRPEENLVEGLLPREEGVRLPDWLDRGEWGWEFEVMGPMETPPDSGLQADLPAPKPDPQLWQELGNGERVRRVLEDFYARVYADALLSPFFHGVTIDRSIEKQYSFLRQLMTGERVYFGDRPRNAHHWMVISDELFDHRQALMQAVLQAHGLSDTQIARWTRLELHYRPDIVKGQAWARRLDGIALPLDGHGREVLGTATLCDHCGAALDAGTEVSYHLRLGLVSCGACTGATT